MCGINYKIIYIANIRTRFCVMSQNFSYFSRSARQHKNRKPVTLRSVNNAPSFFYVRHILFSLADSSKRSSRQNEIDHEPGNWYFISLDRKRYEWRHILYLKWKEAVKQTSFHLHFFATLDNLKGLKISKSAQDKYRRLIDSIASFDECK